MYVRTLFQVPYVHLFEWWLLILFMERGFAGLPWRMFDDALAVGDDLDDEIEESFDLIRQYARLTPTGKEVVAHLRQMVAEAGARWQCATLAAGRGGAKASVRGASNAGTTSVGTQVSSRAVQKSSRVTLRGASGGDRTS